MQDQFRILPDETRDGYLKRLVLNMTESGEFKSLDARHNVASKWWETLQTKSEQEADKQPAEVHHSKMIIERVEKMVDEEDEERKARFIASTSDEDRQGDTINQDGWELRDFRKNPVLLFGHDSRSLPIGKVEDIDVKDGKLMADTVGVPEGVHDMADKVWSMVKSGFLNAVSVGFRALDYEPRFGDDGEWLGFHFLSQELLELSIVPVPANAGAIMVARCYGADKNQISEMFSENVDKHWDALVQSEFRRKQLEIMKLRSGVTA